MVYSNLDHILDTLSSYTTLPLSNYIKQQATELYKTNYISMLITLTYLLLVYSGGSHQIPKILNVPVYNRLSEGAVTKLNKVFSTNPNPSRAMLKQLSIKMNLKESQVYNWFRRKRAQKKQKAVNTSPRHKPNILS